MLLLSYKVLVQVDPQLKLIQSLLEAWVRDLIDNLMTLCQETSVCTEG